MEPPADPGSGPGQPRPPGPPAGGRCARCGAPHDPYQEYCLECGARLARYYPRATWIWQREMWSRDSPLWLWAALAALLLVALVSGAIVAVAATDNDNEGRRRAGGAGPTSSLQILTDVTISTLPPTVIIPPTTTATVPTLPTTTAATTTAPTTTSGGTIIAWPSGKRGYTVVLASVPTSQGRSRAEAKAREAIDDDLSEVGILNSSDYSSLNGGFWVVFSGVHDTLAQAQSALPGVRSAGYPIAYVREIVP